MYSPARRRRDRPAGKRARTRRRRDGAPRRTQGMPRLLRERDSPSGSWFHFPILGWSLGSGSLGSGSLGSGSLGSGSLGRPACRRSSWCSGSRSLGSRSLGRPACRRSSWCSGSRSVSTSRRTRRRDRGGFRGNRRPSRSGGGRLDLTLARRTRSRLALARRLACHQARPSPGAILPFADHLR